MKKLQFSTVALLALLCSGCQLGIFSYAPTVQQGYPLSDKQTTQITPGQTKEQVQLVLGSPTLVNPGNANEWVYIDTKLTHHQYKQQRLHLLFQDDRLKTKRLTSS